MPSLFAGLVSPVRINQTKFILEYQCCIFK
jgi:hypothetical protein